MKTITQYKQEQKNLAKRLEAIRATAINEKRNPNSEELKIIHEIVNQIEEIDAIIEAESRTQETFEHLLEPEARMTHQPPGSSFVSESQRQKDLFPSFGEFLSAVYRAGSPGGTVDPRLREVRAATGLSETVPSDGGFLLQPEFSSRLLQQVFETGVVAQQVTTIPMMRTSLKIPGIDETSRATGSRYGGIRGYWADEASEKTASKPKFRQIELNLRKLIGLCYATDELLEDVGALETVITNGFRDEFAFLIDDALINGTGAGMPLGIMNAGCLVTQNKETGQAASTIEYKNVLKMWSRLFARSWPSAQWYINQNVIPQLGQMNIAVGTGGTAVYVPPGGASTAPYGTLFGRPVQAIEHCQSLGTAGDIILGDFRNGYLLGRKGAMASDMSIHVRFVYDESVFRFVVRVDGQPVLASAVTPYKGGSSYTQGHFVVLQTRS